LGLSARATPQSVQGATSSLPRATARANVAGWHTPADSHVAASRLGTRDGRWQARRRHGRRPRCEPRLATGRRLR